MAFTILIENKKEFRLFYSAVKFKTGKTVTGYFIYPNLTKSDVFTFDELGDGVYTVTITHKKQTNSNMDKYGLVIKENGSVKRIEIVYIQN